MKIKISILSLVAVSLFTAVLINSCNSSSAAEPEDLPGASINPGPSDNSNPVVVHLTKDQFLQKVYNYKTNSEKWVYEGDKPCIVDFYADWCQPCKIAAPILEELAGEYKGQIYVYKVDTQSERELAGAFGIKSIPTFLLCPLDGQPQVFSGIGQTEEETRTIFKKAIDEVLLNNKN